MLPQRSPKLFNEIDDQKNKDADNTQVGVAIDDLYRLPPPIGGVVNHPSSSSSAPQKCGESINWSASWAEATDTTAQKDSDNADVQKETDDNTNTETLKDTDNHPYTSNSSSHGEWQEAAETKPVWSASWAEASEYIDDAIADADNQQNTACSSSFDANADVQRDTDNHSYVQKDTDNSYTSKASSHEEAPPPQPEPANDADAAAAFQWMADMSASILATQCAVLRLENILESMSSLQGRVNNIEKHTKTPSIRLPGKGGTSLDTPETPFVAAIGKSNVGQVVPAKLDVPGIGATALEVSALRTDITNHIRESEHIFATRLGNTEKQLRSMIEEVQRNCNESTERRIRNIIDTFETRLESEKAALRTQCEEKGKKAISAADVGSQIDNQFANKFVPTLHEIQSKLNDSSVLRYKAIEERCEFVEGIIGDLCAPQPAQPNEFLKGQCSILQDYYLCSQWNGFGSSTYSSSFGYDNFPEIGHISSSGLSPTNDVSLVKQCDNKQAHAHIDSLQGNVGALRKNSREDITNLSHALDKRISEVRADVQACVKDAIHEFQERVEQGGNIVQGNASTSVAEVVAESDTACVTDCSRKAFFFEHRHALLGAVLILLWLLVSSHWRK